MRYAPLVSTAMVKGCTAKRLPRLSMVNASSRTGLPHMSRSRHSTRTVRG